MRLNQNWTMKDGGQFVVRSMEKSDAPAAIWLMRKVAGETEFLMRELDECGMTIAQEEAFIEKMNENAREALIGAFIDGELTAMASVSQAAHRFRARHRAAVGVSVEKKHWGKGIGTAMMRVCMELARKAGYEQMELEVVENNERAIRLYRRLGFETTGRIPCALKYRDDSYADLLMMVCRL